MDDSRKIGSGPGPLPERWLRCPRKADSLIVDKFLAFKTPLDTKFNEQVPIQYRFTPDMVFQSAKNMTSSAKHNERPRIGLWIDLTRTKRFYDSETIVSNECKYMKIECHGHEGAPSPEQTRTFIDLCKIFVSRDPINLIAVHCTHGFNRTGFLIASYLVEEMECSVEAALSQFANARKPGIYKGDYLKELYHRYDDVADAPSPPPLPDWCYDEPNELEEANANRCNGNGNGRKKKSPRFNDNPTFMEGVSGAEPVTDREVVMKIRRRIMTLTKRTEDWFVGSQPVSMDRTNLRLLSEKAYRVSWKADGTRYMMFVGGEDDVYFIDRDNSVFKVDKLKFFAHNAPDQHLADTLLDGEMVIDKDGSKLYPRYLVYDIVCLQGEDIGEKAFVPDRMTAIQNRIIEPRRQAMREGRIQQDREPFSVRAKPFYYIQHASTLLGEKFAKQLTHPPDGLIFQPVDDPYVYGTSDQVLKWKPSSMNSIDFKLDVKLENRPGCLPEHIGYLLTGSGRPFGRIKCNKALRALNHKIIECKFVKNQWVFMRERTDKSFPNAEKTALAVMESIKSPVTEAMLLEYIESHGFREPMPPPQRSPPVKRPRMS